MTLRQSILKLVYPLFVLLNKKNSNKVFKNTQQTPPPVSFYSLPLVLNNGNLLELDQLKGKKILIVNTASNCGYTAQYQELQQLQEKFSDKLQVIAFPANDFKEQEKGSDEEIARFCQKNFGVTFPISKKSTVIKSADQNKVFEWLTNKSKNGWNDHNPSWNFSKFLINEHGILTHCFHPAISPFNEVVVKELV